MPTVCYENRRRAAKAATKALQRLGLALKTQVLVTQDGDVYVTCETKNPVATAILSDGELVDPPPTWPDASNLHEKVAELYRGQAIVRFQGASGGGMVPADATKPNGPRANRRPIAVARRR